MTIAHQRGAEIESLQTHDAYSAPPLAGEYSMAKRRSRRRAKNEGVPSIEQIRAGLPLSALDALAAELNVERSVLAHIVGVSLRTRGGKRGGDTRLGSAASDRLARVRRIRDLATHVFGEREKANLWLTSPSRGLNREIPLRLLDTDLGTQRVQEILGQIEHSMPF